MTAPGWRVTLGCGCTYRFGAPDLAQPYVCRVDDHGLTAIVIAVRLPEMNAAVAAGDPPEYAPGNDDGSDPF